MKINLKLNRLAFQEIYELTYNQWLNDTDIVIKKNLRIFYILIGISILILFLRYLNPEWIYFSLAALFIGLYFVFKSAWIIKRIKNQIRKSRSSVEKWLNDLSQKDKWTLEIENNIRIIGDSEIHEYQFSVFDLSELNDDYIYLSNSKNKSESVLIPRKTVTDSEYIEIKRLIKEKINALQHHINFIGAE